MSERPEFERVLSEHGDVHTCVDSGCDWMWPSDPTPLYLHHRAHLAAALNAEVDRWLADKGTRDRIGQALVDYENAKGSLEDTSIDGYVSAALAALTTPIADDRTTADQPEEQP